MSFTFNWPRFSDQFHYDAIQMLNTALNKGNMPPIIADKIEVVELEMGTQPPELEIRDIGDLTVDQFRGIFRLTYSGDAHLVLKTKVQANPLNHKLPDIHQLSGSSGMLAAKQPLVVPMLLRLSHFRLSSYVVLVISKQKGITIVFKTDPLQNVDINSTFDSIAVIQSFIQREIEGQLRQMFKEDLPSIIHRLSQQWVKAKVETPYQKQNQSSLKKPPPAQTPPKINQPISERRELETMSTPDLSMPPYNRRRTAAASDIHPSHLRHPPARRAASTIGISHSGHSPLSAPPITQSNSSTSTLTTPAPIHDTSSSFPDLEHFDPTYGLRPEGLPTKPIFKGFSRLFTQNKGLVDLAEEALSITSGSSTTADEDSDYQDSTGSLSDDGEFEVNSYDLVEWGGSSNGAYATPPPEPALEYETIPAIGGGTVTRPRVVHSQSQIQSPLGIISPPNGYPTSSSSTSPKNVASIFSAAGAGGGSGSPGIFTRNISNPYFSEYSSATPYAPQYGMSAASPVPSSASPVMSRGRRPGSYADGSGYYEGVDGNIMKKGGSHAYLMHEEAVYMQGRVGAFPHPYDLERERYMLHEEDEADDGEEYDTDTNGPTRQHELRQRQDYLSAKPSPLSTASSPPRPVRPAGKRRLSISSNTTTRTSISSSVPFVRHHPNQSSMSLDPSSSHPFAPSSPPNHNGFDPTKIVLRPSLLNNSIHHLSTLSHSNHTLSPYTRSLEHFAVRSGPPRAQSTAAVDPSGMSKSAPFGGGPGNGGNGRAKGITTAGIVGLGATRMGKSKAEVVVKARRKRTFRIGGAKKDPATVPSAAPSGGDFHDERERSDEHREQLWAMQNGYVEGSLKGKERQRQRRKRRPSFSGTDFDEADMDRYFKSMQDAEGEEVRPRGKDIR